MWVGGGEGWVSKVINFNNTESENEIGESEKHWKILNSLVQNAPSSAITKIYFFRYDTPQAIFHCKQCH